MNRSIGIAVLSCLCAVVVLRATSADYKLLNGKSYKGDPTGANNVSVIIRDPDASTNAPRTAWTNFTQEALKEFAKNAKLKQYVEILIEEPEQDLDTSLMPTVQKRARPAMKLVPVEKPQRYKPRPGFIGSIFTSAIGWFTLFILYAANLYAGYEVAIYRRRPIKLVIGVCAAAPLFGPITFLCMPEIKRVTEAPPPVAAEEEEIKAPGPRQMHKGPGVAAHGASASGPLADVPTIAPQAAPVPKTQYFRRGEVSFNRRYIESKFAPFFKMVLGEKEQDLFLVFNTVRGQFITQHVVKATQADMTVKIEAENGASCDESFPFNDIQEIQIRHREATD
ncbi:MAG: hypothetical protein FJ386_06340 [Verrucomicrobia bacterium]|nr:hypothetical protein [Verrucomicrobiota bacterium]